MRIPPQAENTNSKTSICGALFHILWDLNLTSFAAAKPGALFSRFLHIGVYSELCLPVSTSCCGYTSWVSGPGLLSSRSTWAFHLPAWLSWVSTLKHCHLWTKVTRKCKFHFILYVVRNPPQAEDEKYLSEVNDSSQCQGSKNKAANAGHYYPRALGKDSTTKLHVDSAALRG